MSLPFDYSKWDKLELSDDEDDVHPNIDRESWFRMKHRSRVEREEREEADKKRIRQEMDKANQRIKVLQHDLDKLKAQQDGDDSDDDDLGESEGIQKELEELQKSNAEHQAKLDEYERNKKWNVDNICHVKEERTVISSSELKHTPDGYALPTTEPTVVVETVTSDETEESADGKPAAVEKKEATPASEAAKPKPEPKKEAKKPAAVVAAKSKAVVETVEPDSSASSSYGPSKDDLGAFETYHEFTEKYADLVEEFMAISELSKSKEFLLKHGDVLLQENASNYLLLASLEDEMNGYRQKMKGTARQSQIISNIAELAKSLDTHPGNVILPFFARLETREGMTAFMENVETFIQKIIARAVTKKLEMDREQQGEDAGEAVDLASVPREERLGPGGLDPLEVIETLPIEMQQAFESRDVEKLKDALLKMEPAEAEQAMKQCIDSGLWNPSE